MSEQSKAVGDNPLVTGRIAEKSDLQDLNQRFSAYIQNVRSWRTKQQQNSCVHEETHRNEQLTQLRSMYDEQLSDLRLRLEQCQREKNEIEASRAKYDTMSSEFEIRLLSLNETVLKQNDEITRMQVALSNKELELQKSQSQLTGPRTELESCRLERDDFKQRLVESQRRCQAEEKAKAEFQNQLSDLHGRCSHELLLYQQEINDLHDRLEKSRQLVLEMEETARRSGQQNGDVALMLRNAREASEAELRRYIDESESKHNLTIADLKLRMEADTRNLTTLIEENGQLRVEINSLSGALEGMQSKFTSAESALKVTEGNLGSERKAFEIQLHRMESKLQETQDLLMIKIQELTAAQEANIPLRAEIDMLKNLIEEEEKRFALEGKLGPRGSYSISNTDFTTSNTTTTNKTSTANLGIGDATVGSYKHVTSALGDEKGLFAPLNGVPKRPSSVPLTTQGFVRRQHGTATGFDAYQASSPRSSYQTKNHSRNDRMRPQSASSASSSVLDVNNHESEVDEFMRQSRVGRGSPGVNQLPPRPNNPTPPRILPKRPLSAANTRYVSADAGQGRDYFEAMFNDLRKDSMYTKVTEDNVGVDTTKVTSSTQHDLVNSTARHEVMPGKNGNLWYSGATASATGNMKIVQVDDDGRFVRVHNASSTRAEDIGGYLLQQNVAGHPVAVFRFPPRTKLQPSLTATVWSASNLDGIHDPPMHYVWKQLDKWGTGPECTTILCKPNGQAVAWMTSAPRVSRTSKAYQYEPDVMRQTREMERLMEELRAKNLKQAEGEDNVEGGEGDGRYGRVALSMPASYGMAPTMYTDSPTVPMPAPTLRREKNASQSLTPGRLLPTRTGSAPLRKYNAPPAPVRHDSQTMAYQQRLAQGGDAELIDLTTQKSARSKYGFDFMTHPPKVINYDGTVRER